MSRPRLIALLLALVTLVVFQPVTRHDFLNYDDDDYVTDNQVVQQGLTLAGVRWAFTTFHAGNWHPLTWLSHMTDCECFALNAGAHHFVNALLHAANAALLFLLLWRLTGLLPPALLTAAWFAWHPLHVESVAWVAERKDVLSTFFALLALLGYARYAREKSRAGYALALGGFTLGLLAKPMLVTLPLLLLVLDYWPLQRFSPASRWALAREKLPFFALAAASGIVTFIAQRSGHAVSSLADLPLAYRLENSVVAVARYLGKIVWPADLCVLYPLGPISGTAVAVAVAVVILISIGVWRARHRHRCWLAGWLWFLGGLLPVIGLVQVGSTALADRYTYFPAVGMFFAVAYGLGSLAGGHKWFPVAGALLLVPCVLATEKQLTYWRDSETLFRRALAVTQNNDLAHLNLGIALDLHGRPAGALAEFREVVRLRPDKTFTHFPIGNLLLKAGQPAAALAEYRQCLATDPQVPALHNAAGCALAALGNLAAARPEFAEAERLDPHYAQPHLELARIGLLDGQDAQARQELEAAVAAQPNDVGTLVTAAHYLAANTNDAARDGQSALLLALRADQWSHRRQPQVFDVLGMAFASTGDFTNAVICAQNALAFAPAARQADTSAFQARLELYLNHQPWRESFRGTNAPPAK